MPQLSQGLFGVIDTLKASQCSIFSLGSTANATAQKVQSLMSEQGVEGESRSAVIIVERSFDLSVSLLHPWHYGALLHDILCISNNKVSTGETPFDLDMSTDTFWADKINTPFPYVACDLEKELNDWKDNYQSMAHKRQFDNVTPPLYPPRHPT